jgi:hypothetical protein
MPTGLAQHRNGDLHPRPGDQAILNRLPDAQIRPAGVPHRGDADLEGAPQVDHGFVKLVRERLVQLRDVVQVPAEHDVQGSALDLAGYGIWPKHAVRGTPGGHRRGGLTRRRSHDHR